MILKPRIAEVLLANILTPSMHMPIVYCGVDHIYVLECHCQFLATLLLELLRL
jgi:hypothetical protein